MAISLSQSILPKTLKWTIVADAAAAALQSLTYLPSTIFGIPTVGWVTVVAAVLTYWETYALQQEASGTTAPTGGSTPTTPPPSSPTPPTMPSVPANYGTVVSGVIQVTTANAAYTTDENGNQTLNAPLNSWVQKTSLGWYQVCDSNGNLLTYTKQSPIQGM